jgi:hypothetical protein
MYQMGLQIGCSSGARYHDIKKNSSIGAIRYVDEKYERKYRSK